MPSPVLFPVGSLWRAIARQQIVRVVASEDRRVRYEELPGGRSRLTWADAFLKRFEPARTLSLVALEGRIAQAARAGELVTLTPQESRLLLRNLESGKRRDWNRRQRAARNLLAAIRYPRACSIHVQAAGETMLVVTAHGVPSDMQVDATSDLNRVLREHAAQHNLDGTFYGTTTERAPEPNCAFRPADAVSTSTELHPGETA